MDNDSQAQRHNQSTNTEAAQNIKKKPFRELFNRAELWYYGIAALVYIGLGILVQNWVLNVAVGLIFIVAWMWIVPPLVDGFRANRRRSREFGRTVVSAPEYSVCVEPLATPHPPQACSKCYPSEYDDHPIRHESAEVKTE